MVDCLLYLESAINLHEVEDKIGALLSERLRLLKSCMETLRTAQTCLEGERYGTFSQLMPYISDLRDGLNRALDYLKLPASADDPAEVAEMKAVISCVGTLIEVSDNR